MSTATGPRTGPMDTPADGTPVVLVAECAGDDWHLMVAASVDHSAQSRLRAAVQALLDGEGLWCGPAAASSRCRTGLLELVVGGGVSAEIVDAHGHDDPTQARTACLAGVAELADTAGAAQVLLVRDDVCAATDAAGSVALFRRVGASPDLRCAHADVEGEPLTVLAEVVLWCWVQGGALCRAVASTLTGVRLV